MRPSGARAATILTAVILIGAAIWLARSGPGRLPVALPTPPEGPPATPAVTSSPAPRPGGEASPSAPPARIPAVQVEGSRITGSDPTGRVQWEIEAVAVEVDGERQIMRLSQVRGRFFEQGAPVMTVSAPQGVFSIESGSVVLTGGVRAEARTGRAVRAGRLEWRPRERRVVATGNVVLVQGRLTIRADRLETDIALRKSRLTGNIRVTVMEAGDG